jgi:hypothetical protein
VAKRSGGVKRWTHTFEACATQPIITAIEEGRGSIGALIEVKQSAEACGFVNSPFAATRWLVRERDDILKSLMIALMEKVTQIPFESMVQ